jgi:HK97 family phage major capsid protein
MGEMYIPPLYANSVLPSIGATFLTGLVGNVDIPKGGSATAYWLATETTDITGSTPATASVTMSPKTVGALVDLSRTLLLQSSPVADQLVRQDLVNVLSRALDVAAINGSGLSGQPTGILGTSGIGAVALGAAGDAPTWASIINLMREVEVDNIAGNFKWLTNPKVVAKLRQTPKVSSTDSVMIMNEMAETLVGYPVFVSNSVPSNLTKTTGTALSALIYGDFSNLFVGNWGILEVDTTNSDGTKFQSGQITVRALQTVDIAVRYPEAFSAIKDMVTT